MAGTTLSSNAMATDIIDSGTCGDNCSWEIDGDYNLIIKPTDGKTAEMNNYEDSAYVPWAPYIRDVSTIDVKNGISNLGDFAFSSAYSITEISLPNSLTDIGENAFEHATGLTTLILPDSLETIGKNAFSNLENLESLVIPTSITEIGDYAFSWSNGGVIFLPDNYDVNVIMGREPFNHTPCEVETYWKTDEGIYYNSEADSYHLSLNDMIEHNDEECYGIQNCQAKLLENQGLCDFDDCYELLENYEDGDEIILNGQKYASLSDLFAGNALPSTQEIHNSDGSITLKDADGNIIGFKNKKIYTINEATSVAKPVGNTIRIKYR